MPPKQQLGKKESTKIRRVATCGRAQVIQRPVIASSSSSAPQTPLIEARLNAVPKGPLLDAILKLLPLCFFWGAGRAREGGFQNILDLSVQRDGPDSAESAYYGALLLHILSIIDNDSSNQMTDRKGFSFGSDLAQMRDAGEGSSGVTPSSPRSVLPENPETAQGILGRQIPIADISSQTLLGLFALELPEGVKPLLEKELSKRTRETK